MGERRDLSLARRMVRRKEARDGKMAQPNSTLLQYQAAAQAFCAPLLPDAYGATRYLRPIPTIAVPCLCRVFQKPSRSWASQLVTPLKLPRRL